jgi:hypothetical protein
MSHKLQEFLELKQGQAKFMSNARSSIISRGMGLIMWIQTRRRGQCSERGSIICSVNI